MTCASTWSNRWRAGLFASACLTALPAHASFLEGEALDSVASALALIILFVVPIVGIAAFWMVHVLPEKIAHKRHHPQRDAIHMLCLLSLVFGGLLWPLAFLWAYSKPVLHKLAYGTDKHDDYFTEHASSEHVAAAPAPAAASLQTDVAALRGNVERMLATGGTQAELTALRDQLAALEPRIAAQTSALATPAKESH